MVVACGVVAACCASLSIVMVALSYQAQQQVRHGCMPVEPVSPHWGCSDSLACLVEQQSLAVLCKAAPVGCGKRCCSSDNMAQQQHSVCGLLCTTSIWFGNHTCSSDACSVSESKRCCHCAARCVAWLAL